MIFSSKKGVKAFYLHWWFYAVLLIVFVFAFFVYTSFPSQIELATENEVEEDLSMLDSSSDISEVSEDLDVECVSDSDCLSDEYCSMDGSCSKKEQGEAVSSVGSGGSSSSGGGSSGGSSSGGDTGSVADSSDADGDGFVDSEESLMGYPCASGDSNECAEGYCYAGVCTDCAEDSHCASGEFCDGGVCAAAPCSSDSDCASSEVCSSGECIPAPAGPALAPEQETNIFVRFFTWLFTGNRD